jgi:hypothetical protein
VKSRHRSHAGGLGLSSDQPLQINDITFDDEVMRSMSKIVAANNLKAAAEKRRTGIADYQDQSC